MFSSAIIVFREVLEAALIIGIVCAATREIHRRNRWVAGGVAVGILGSALVAAFADVVADAASGMGQELFNALVLFIVVIMLGWHNIWMARHGAEMSFHAKAIGASVREGSEPITVLLALVGLAVLREGAEVVLFLYGIAAGGSGATDMVLGSGLGLLVGMATGFGLYFGLVRIPTRYFFTVTAMMILILAGGMASQGAKYLIQAGFLPTWGDQLWDSSWLVSDRSLAGEVLGTLAGYDSTPTGMQLVFYLATVVAIYVGMKSVESKRRQGKRLAEAIPR